MRKDPNCRIPIIKKTIVSEIGHKRSGDSAGSAEIWLDLGYSEISVYPHKFGVSGPFDGHGSIQGALSSGKVRQHSFPGAGIVKHAVAYHALLHEHTGSNSSVLLKWYQMLSFTIGSFNARLCECGDKWVQCVKCPVGLSIQAKKSLDRWILSSTLEQGK